MVWGLSARNDHDRLHTHLLVITAVTSEEAKPAVRSQIRLLSLDRQTQELTPPKSGLVSDFFCKDAETKSARAKYAQT